jgi:PAS domain S-box-containing protein
MEHMVIAELERQKELLSRKLKDEYGLGEDASLDICRILEDSLSQMIRLMKEGKNAHEKFFSDIILNSVDAIIGIDNEYKIFLWNNGAENIFGYNKVEVVGKDFTFLIPEALLKKGERDFLINEVNLKGSIAGHETERITKDGRVLKVSLSRFPVFNEQKEIIGSVGIIRDMTKLKKLEQELREKENLALIGEVVSSIAHSLSNPLNIISGNADYLLLDRAEDDKEYEELKTIIDETSRITKSIRHLLNFSRPIQVNKERNDLNEIIEGIIASSKFLSDGKKITIKKSLDAKLKPFEFDRNEIEEVILNIITNAVQAIISDGEIKIKTAKDNGAAKIEISDNGPGIPKENLDKIFLPFFSSKEYGKGTGLGLSIAMRIIKEHGGELTVKSQVGKGTAFSICLPVIN